MLAHSISKYTEIASRIATGPGFREQLRTEIQKGLKTHPEETDPVVASKDLYSRINPFGGLLTNYSTF